MAVVPLRGGGRSIRRSTGRRGGMTFDVSDMERQLSVVQRNARTAVADSLYFAGLEINNAEKAEVRKKFDGPRRRFLEEFVARPRATQSRLVQYVMPRGSTLSKKGKSERILSDHQSGKTIKPNKSKGSASRLTGEDGDYLVIPTDELTHVTGKRIQARGKTGKVPNKYNPNYLEATDVTKGRGKKKRNVKKKNQLVIIGKAYYIEKRTTLAQRDSGENKTQLIRVGTRVKRANLPQKFDFFRVAKKAYDSNFPRIVMREFGKLAAKT